MHNPAPGSRIRSIRALDPGLGADVGRLPCARRGYRLAGRGARQAVGPHSHLRSDGGSWVRPPSKRNLIRLGPLDNSGLRGEGSIPVPPPPDWPRPCILRANSLAIKLSNSSDFSFGLWTPDRQGRLIILRKAHFSPKLWTPSIRYVFEIRTFRVAYDRHRKEVVRLLSDRRERPISNSPS
jgi:hypothetical protein